MVRKLIGLVIGILGLLLSFSGLGLIQLTPTFLLYLGLVLLIIAVLLFIRG